MDEQLEEADQRLQTEGLSRGPGGGAGQRGQILEVSNGLVQPRTHTDPRAWPGAP